MSDKEIHARDLGVIQKIEKVENLNLRPIGPMVGSNGAQAGFSQMTGLLGGHSSMDGYRVETDRHTVLVLIDSSQDCCESWGYVDSAENLNDFVGGELREIVLTDTALNAVIVERHQQKEYGFDGGGIQFVDFLTSKGKLQLAVYNAHNGYYGHGIVVALDGQPLHEDTL